jgi:hypothetical protein
MFAVATCRGAPHLRRQNSPRSRPGRVGPFGTPRPGRLHSRAEAHPTCGAYGSSMLSSPIVNRLCFRHRRPAPFGWVVPAQQNSHNSSNISVSVKSPSQGFPRKAEAVRGPKLTARPDVVKASEGHFPQQCNACEARGIALVVGPRHALAGSLALGRRRGARRRCRRCGRPAEMRWVVPAVPARTRSRADDGAQLESVGRGHGGEGCLCVAAYTGHVARRRGLGHDRRGAGLLTPDRLLDPGGRGERSPA